MIIQLVFGAACLLNAIALLVDNSRLIAWLMVLAGFGYGFAVGWWGYDKYPGVF